MTAKVADVRNPNFVATVFAGLIALQTLGFLMLRTGRAGISVTLVILVAHNLLALVCAWIAFRRARNVAALFWFLYAVSLLTLLIPTAFGAYDVVFERSSLSASTWRVLYCLYGAPILMMLFLPETDRERLRSESFSICFRLRLLSASPSPPSFFCRCGRCCPPPRFCGISASAT